MTGNPIPSTTFIASSLLHAEPLAGVLSPIRCMACLKASRSSALWIASAEAPINWTLYLARVPRLANPTAMFSAVCPPIVGSSASGCSRSITCSTTSSVMGSM